MLVEHSALTPRPILCSAHLWKRYSSLVIVLLQVRLASSLFLNVENNTVVSFFFCHRPTTLNVWVKIRSNRYKSFFSRLLFATAYGKMTLWAWRRRVKDWNDNKSMCDSTHCTKWPFCFWQAHVSLGREVPRERERERGGGGNGEWAWAYSGRTYLNPLNHFNSSASTSPCWHALSRFFSRLSPE